MDPQNSQAPEPVQNPEQAQTYPEPQPQPNPDAPSTPPAPGVQSSWQQGLGTIAAPSAQPDSTITAQPYPPTLQQPFPATTTPNPAKKKPMLLVAIIAAVVLVLAGAGAFWFWHSKNANSQADNVAKQSSKTAGNGAKDMATLRSVSFVAPSAMSAYDSVVAASNNTVMYATKGSTAGKYCDINWGVYPATQLPGNDINAIIKPQLDTLKKNGATITGPVAGTALVVKDSQSSTAYSMPTLNFDISQGSKHESDHYSVVVLSSGDRAVVVRACANANGTINASDLANLDETAKQLTIKQ